MLGFSKINNWVQNVTGWAGFIALLSASYAWLASQLTPMNGFGWADFVAMGIGAALVTTLVLAVILTAWRFFRPLPLSQKTRVTPAVDRDIALDLVHLLHFAVDAATYVAIKRLIEAVPMHSVPLEGDRDRIHDIKFDLSEFIRKTEKLSGGQSGDGPAFCTAMHKATGEADDELSRRLTESHELTKVMNPLREALHLEKQRDAALEFLRYRLRNKEEALAEERENLIDRKDRRAGH